MKRSYERILSAGLILYESYAFRMRRFPDAKDDFSRAYELRTNSKKRARGTPRVSLPRLVRKLKTEQLHVNAKLSVIGG